MLTDKASHLLTELKHGRFNTQSASAVESLSATAFVDELRIEYGFVFQRGTSGVNERSVWHETCPMNCDSRAGRIHCCKPLLCIRR